MYRVSVLVICSVAVTEGRIALESSALVMVQTSSYFLSCKTKGKLKQNKEKLLALICKWKSDSVEIGSFHIPGCPGAFGECLLNQSLCFTVSHTDSGPTSSTLSVISTIVRETTKLLSNQPVFKRKCIMCCYYFTRSTFWHEFLPLGYKGHFQPQIFTGSLKSLY